MHFSQIVPRRISQLRKGSLNYPEDTRLKSWDLSDIDMIGWRDIAETLPKGLKPHSHVDGYEICFIKSGTNHWQVHGQTYALNPNDIYITWPGEVHGGAQDMLGKSEIFWVIFRLDRRKGSLGLSPSATVRLADALNQLDRRQFAGHPAIAEHYEGMLDACNDPSPLAENAIYAHLQLLIIDVIQAFQDACRQEAPATSDQARVARAMRYIEYHLETQIHVPDLAAQAGLRPSYFREVFRQETGFSPSDFVARRRMQHAQNLLRTTDRPITDIAHALGFSSSQYFATTFRKYAGMTPTAYRDVQNSPPASEKRNG